MSSNRKQLFLVTALVTLALTACGDVGDGAPVTSSSQSLSGTEIVAATGRASVNGQDAWVEVIVRVPRGQRGRRMALDAVRGQGAVPIEDALHDEDTETGYTFTGLSWPGGAVTQYYDESDSPIARRGILTDAQVSWNEVPSAVAVITDGGATTRCPSLVKECPGKQTWDGNNDVNWISIKDRNTLGVTWSGDGSFGPEADMSLNTRYGWSDDNAGDVDAQTVMLHELGHVLGIGHSTIGGAVMEPVYAGPRRSLHHDDESAVTVLYPAWSCGDGSCDAGEDECSCAADCGGPGAEICDDGVDNDCDGLADCDDDLCSGDPIACPPPPAAFCGDGSCDDGEDRCGCPVDCGAPPASESACSNGEDDDCDGLVDVLDGDCPACKADGEKCNDSAQCCGTGCYVGGGPPRCDTL